MQRTRAVITWSWAWYLCLGIFYARFFRVSIYKIALVDVIFSIWGRSGCICWRNRITTWKRSRGIRSLHWWARGEKFLGWVLGCFVAFQFVIFANCRDTADLLSTDPLYLNEIVDLVGEGASIANKHKMGYGDFRLAILCFRAIFFYGPLILPHFSLQPTSATLETELARNIF